MPRAPPLQLRTCTPRALWYCTHSQGPRCCRRGRPRQSPHWQTPVRRRILQSAVAGPRTSLQAHRNIPSAASRGPMRHAAPPGRHTCGSGGVTARPCPTSRLRVAPRVRPLHCGALPVLGRFRTPEKADGRSASAGTATRGRVEARGLNATAGHAADLWPSARAATCSARRWGGPTATPLTRAVCRHAQTVRAWASHGPHAGGASTVG